MDSKFSPSNDFSKAFYLLLGIIRNSGNLPERLRKRIRAVSCLRHAGTNMKTQHAAGLARSNERSDELWASECEWKRFKVGGTSASPDRRALFANRRNRTLDVFESAKAHIAGEEGGDD